MNLDQLLEEAIPLIAEDLKEFRTRFSLTSFRAAKRARLDVLRYRALEAGAVPKTRHNAAQLISVARRLGLDSLRMGYVNEIDQHMRLSLTGNKQLTIYPKSSSWLRAGLRKTLVDWGDERIERGPRGSPCG